MEPDTKNNFNFLDESGDNLNNNHNDSSNN